MAWAGNDLKDILDPLTPAVERVATHYFRLSNPHSTWSWAPLGMGQKISLYWGPELNIAPQDCLRMEQMGQSSPWPGPGVDQKLHFWWDFSRFYPIPLILWIWSSVELVCEERRRREFLCSIKKGLIAFLCCWAFMLDLGNHRLSHSWDHQVWWPHWWDVSGAKATCPTGSTCILKVAALVKDYSRHSPSSCGWSISNLRQNPIPSSSLHKTSSSHVKHAGWISALCWCLCPGSSS